jgi:hypothetical protein
MYKKCGISFIKKLKIQLKEIKHWGMQMTRKYLVLFIFICSLPSLCFAFDYWWLDVFVDNYSSNYETKPSTQRAYFFKDLNSLQEATGFPRGVGNDSSARSFNWTPNPNWRDYPHYKYYGTIYSTMRREGFSYAFIMDMDGVSAVGQRRYWSYVIFMLRDGVEYYTGANRYDTPIRF